MQIADTPTDSQIDFAANEHGQQMINDIERLQNYLLDELDSLNDRVKAVFKTYGYKLPEELEAEQDAVEN